MKNGIIIFLIFFVFCSKNYPQQIQQEFPELSGPYLGQTAPGETPKLFAPGIISTGINERDFAVTADGKEIYYGIAIGRTMTIMCSREIDGKWSEPEAASFAADQNFFFFEPCLTADGNRIYFLTNKPSKGKQPQQGWVYQNIWAADRKPDGTWSEPYDPDTLINGNMYQYFPSVTNDGTLYFTRTDPQTKKPAIYRSRLKAGKFELPERLPEKINGNGEPFNAFIARDESYLIACVDKKQNTVNPGRSNYYIYFRDRDDNWSDGVILGADINIKGSNAMSPCVTPDGKYFFFAAQKMDEKFLAVSGSKKLSYFKSLLVNPQNGNYDIYWVDAKVLQNYRGK